MCACGRANRMAALSDSLTCSLMRGNSNPLAKVNGSTSFSVTYSFEPCMLCNVKRSKCSGIVWIPLDWNGIYFAFLKLVAYLSSSSLISNQCALSEFSFKALPFCLTAWCWPDNQDYDYQISCGLFSYACKSPWWFVHGFICTESRLPEFGRIITYDDLILVFQSNAMVLSGGFAVYASAARRSGQLTHSLRTDESFSTAIRWFSMNG